MVDYKDFLFFIPGLLFLIIWSAHYFSFRLKPSLYYPAKNESFGIKRIGIFISGFIGILLITYALMGPRKETDRSRSQVAVNDIFFVVDVSRSMLADDLQPNRLEVAKKKLQEFVNLRPHDRLGIILFSERVFTLLPLTLDTKVVDGVLGDIKVGYLGAGTNIGDALGLAVARGKDSGTKNKVIILLTDGVSNVGNLEPIQAAHLAANENMKVYTIGLATDKDARIPLGKSLFGTQYQRIPGGSIDMETLQEISKITKGKTFRAKSERALKDILLEIEKLERSDIDADFQIQYEEQYYFYFCLGFFFFFIAELLRRFYDKEIL